MWFLVLSACSEPDCPPGYAKTNDGLCVEIDGGEAHTCPTGFVDNGTGLCLQEDADADADTDTDTDADSDADTDADSDSDTDADTDTDTDPVAYTVCDDGVAPYAEIQSAIDAASDGDTIVVCAGTWSYVEIDRVDVALEGPDGADMTIIDGGSHPALTVADVTVALRGFTLTGTAEDYEPAAMLAIQANITVEDVVVTGCSGSERGYGVLLDSSVSSWDRVLFHDNVDVSTFFVAWNSASEGSSTEVTHAEFRDNAVQRLFYMPDVEITLQNSIFHRNDITSAEVVDMHGEELDAVVWNNVFYDNTTTWRTALYFGAGVDFQNNIIMDSSSEVLFDTAVGLDYNDYYRNGNSNVYYSDGTSEAHSLASDPHFVDPDNGDFHLDPAFSVCVDAGNPLSGYNDVDGTSNDMGAYGGPAGSW